MPSSAQLQQRRRWAVGAAVLAAGVVAVAAGCGGSGTASQPAGISSHQAQAYVSQQVTNADRAASAVLAPEPGSFLAGKDTVTTLGSTTPADGDLNPYAVWPVTRTGGSLTSGDVLVDDFNNASNDQGTGRTIVDVHPDGRVSVFATLPQQVAGCPGGVGLTTAMVQTRVGGWVLVGSLPTTDGKLGTAGAGCLLELSPSGQLVGTLTGPELEGPWDATIADSGATAQLFVTNTLVGVHGSAPVQVDQGTVERLALAISATAPPTVTGTTEVAGGFGERPDAAALVKGPTGLALGADGTLYIGDNLGNRVTSVASALSAPQSTSPGATLSRGGQLANPLGLAVAPDGDLLVANATNGKIVEVTPGGRQVGEYYAIQNVGQDPPGNGDLFGIAIDQAGTGVLFVKDDDNVLSLLH